MSTNKSEIKTAFEKENDVHPGECPSNACPFQVVPKMTGQTGVMCRGCGHVGSAVDAKITACYHFARFAGLGVSPDQKFILVKLRSLVDSSSVVFWTTMNNTEHLTGIVEFFQCLLKKKNLPGLSLADAVAGQALAGAVK